MSDQGGRYWNLRGKPVTVCPPDCPRRCAEPNCHNVETCKTWAEHMAKQEKIYEIRKNKIKDNPYAYKAWGKGMQT